MTKDQRRKAIATAIAEAQHNAFVPQSVKVGLAAMSEELRELDIRLARLELLAGVERAFAGGTPAL